MRAQQYWLFLAMGLACGLSLSTLAQTTVVTPPMQQPYGSAWKEETAVNKNGPVALTPPPADRSGECDSSCLTQLMNRYLDSLTRRDYVGLPVSPNLLVTENGHVSRIGEGVWKVLETLDSERTILTDAINGQVIYIGTLQESAHQPFIFIVRLKIEKQLIAEVESMVTADINAAQHFRPDNLASFDPVILSMLPEEERASRKDLLAAANQMLLGGSEVKLTVGPGCIHWENGDRLALFNCGTSDAARQGGLVYDNRALRHVLVDVERGLVVSYMLKDTSPFLNPNPPDNERTPLFYQRPLTLYALQILKVNKANQILAHHIFMNVQEASMPAIFIPTGEPMPPGPPPAGAAPRSSSANAPAGCPPYSDGDMFDSSPIADAIDVNHDGKLTHDEWHKAGAPENSWKRFMGYPTEKAQGYITRAQFIAEMPPDGIDTNCDHKITLQEFLDISKTLGARPPRS